jgi:bifunctional ADP-heptose synthase (sugar kinase/adenylyltransferase)
VAVFEEETPLTLIEAIQPDVLVKGGDYEIKDIVGADIVHKKGGRVLTIPFVEGKSTSNIIQKIDKQTPN